MEEVEENIEDTVIWTNVWKMMTERILNAKRGSLEDMEDEEKESKRTWTRKLVTTDRGDVEQTPTPLENVLVGIVIKDDKEISKKS
ncbi:hypothetical protein KIN20_023197 [Parelaphostrongylus tenuis]|uniref:Uncharacterized protein n=1 Tax=Parelaphostrongylus tenuis TaxID=148309 RepID=A0AAD5MRC7_PARTN|nr:hypothetical protein KIN20_023197 [Parelaphostrongylus tenuis]